MKPSLRAALAIAASFVFAACAEAPPPAAPPQPEPPPSLFGPAGKGTSPVDEQMLAIAKAEDEIDKLFPHAGRVDEPGRAGKKKPADADKMMDQKKGASGADDAGKLSSGDSDRCAVACRALTSMRSSADHLCKLSGEGDGRCEDARGRVRGATARVRSVCPECAAAK